MRKTLASVLLCLSMPASADIRPHHQYDSYMGLSWQYRQTRWQPQYGNELFSHHTDEINAYIGIMPNPHFSLELGYEQNLVKSQTSILEAGDTFLGTPVEDAPETHNAWVSFRMPYFNVLFFPLTHSTWQPFVLAGVGYMHVSHQDIEVSDVFGPADPTEITNSRRIYEASHAILRLGIGLNYVATNRAILRASICWENTAQLQNIHANDLSQRPAQVNMRNSLLYAIGFCWFF